MIRTSDDFRLEKRRIGGGSGELELRHRLEGSETFGKCRLCAEITLLPGQSIGEHKHEIEAEIYYMLEGELISIGQDGSEAVFRKGDIMMTGGGASHSVRNDSDTPAVMLAIVML